MAIKEQERVSGSGLILSDIAGEDVSNRPDRGALAAFRIVEFEDGEKGDFSWDLPVTADVLVFELDDNGEITEYSAYPEQSIRFAAANHLRGHASIKLEVKAKDIPEPSNDVGDIIITRVQKVKRGKNQPFVALNTPSSVESKKVRTLLKKTGMGEDGAEWTSSEGAAGGGKSDDDDSPPF